MLNDYVMLPKGYTRADVLEAYNTLAPTSEGYCVVFMGPDLSKIADRRSIWRRLWNWIRRRPRMFCGIPWPSKEGKPKLMVKRSE